MSRLPAPLYHASAHRTHAPRISHRSSPLTTPKRPAHLQPRSDQRDRDGDGASMGSRVWLVFLVGLIAGAAVLAMQVNEFLYG